jgi:hypothetical protein
VLVDTPGFDDSFESDQVITEKILKWLESSYRAGTRLDGIIYLHSIARSRMTGSAYDNLCMFRKLCGNDCFKNVILATTFWDSVSSSDGNARVKQLEEDRVMWGRMVQAGSRVVKLQNDRESALEVLASVSPDVKMVLQAQREMVDEGKSAQETAAGKLTASTNTGVREREARLEQLRAASERKADELAKMRERLQSFDQQLEIARLEKERLETSSPNAKLPLPVSPSRQRSSQTRRCRCKLDGAARCTKCSVQIRKEFHRKFSSVALTCRTLTISRLLYVLLWNRSSVSALCELRKSVSHARSWGDGTTECILRGHVVKYFCSHRC